MNYHTRIRERHSWMAMVIYVRGNPIGSFHPAKVKSHASLLGKGLNPTTIATAGKWIKRYKLEEFPNDFLAGSSIWLGASLRGAGTVIPKNARGPVSFMVPCQSGLPRVAVQSIEESDDLWHKLDVVSVQIH